MKRIRYSTGMKICSVVLYEIFCLIFIISTILVITLFNKNMLTLDNLGKNSFLQSSYYQKLFEGVINEVIEYAEFQNQFETDNVYHPKKKIDIMTYGKYDTHETGEYLYAHRGFKLRYYLEDLEKWSYGFQRIELESKNTLYLSEKGKLFQKRQIYNQNTLIGESVREIKEIKDVEDNYGMSFFQTEKKSQNPIKENELISILKEKNLLDTPISTTFFAINEIYSTVDNSSILQKYIEGNISFEEMQEAYQHLYHTLESLVIDIPRYKRLVTKYEDDHSNVRFYLASEEENQVCTNIFKKPESKQELLALGKKLGSYFYYNEKDVRVETTIKPLENKFYQQQSYWNYGYNTMILVGIDEKFPAHDVLWEQKTEYERVQSFALYGLLAMPISMIGILFNLIYLSLVAGRKAEDKETHFIWFDKIKTEIILLAFFLIVVASLYNFIRIWFIYDSSSMTDAMIMISSMFVVNSGIFLLFYMGFVRKVKAGVVWEHSILYRITDECGKIFSNGKMFWKNIIYFISYIFFFLTVLIISIQFQENATILFGVIIILFIVNTIQAIAFFREGIYRKFLIQGIQKIAQGDLEHKIDTEPLKGYNRIIAQEINDIGTGLYHAVDHNVKNERMKADLITNVSHDIKTPLTSIVNYIHLLKREDLQNETAENYIHILDVKAQRLKQLTEDVVEVSRITSGNIQLEMTQLNFVELVYQTAGEFNEKFEEKRLTTITKLPREPVMVLADGRRIWRVIENLYNNVAKYAMENTRVYVDMEIKEENAVFSIKNISCQPLHTDPKELTQRFIRGDVSRSTEGSGLGLSIAENLTKLMGGTFQIFLDGDLFKVQITFPILHLKEEELE